MYTNAQVIAMLQQVIDAQRGASPAVGQPVVAQAAAPVVAAEPERKVKAVKYVCSLHADHKGGKGFTANGRAFHEARCAGTWEEAK